MTFTKFTRLLALALSAAVHVQAQTYTAAADNNILAQQLVYDLISVHCDLIVVSLHGVTPTDLAAGSTFATNLDLVGQPNDADDDAVAIDHKTIMAPSPTNPNRFEIATPLFTSAGTRLNASINMLFSYVEDREGDDLLGLFTRAYNYRDEMAQNITSWEALFEPLESLTVRPNCGFI